MNDLNERSFDQVLRETSDYFSAQGVSIIGGGYAEIASNAALFESYVDQLTEGASADDAANMAQIMANTNAQILSESSLTGIQPIASLSMPVIRRLWPAFVMKDAVETEVAKTPRFVIAYAQPYMYKGEDIEENRIYLPQGIKDDGQYGLPKGLTKTFTAEHAVSLTAGAAAVVDFKFVLGDSTSTADGVTAGALDPAVSVGDTPSAAKLQPLDELVILEAKYATSATETADIKIGKRLGINGAGVYAFPGGQLIVQFDGANRTATFAAIGAAVTLNVKAGVSSEFNEESYSMAQTIKRVDIDIPTGQHINAPLPVEALNDMMALYQIDGTKETVEMMTNTFAQKVDLEIIDFLFDSWYKQPGVEAYADYADAGEYFLEFDLKPAAGFAGSTKAWREELKLQIDYLAQKIRNATYLRQGQFVIAGNPIDIAVLTNVDWQFRGGQGGNVDGVNVDYSIGTFVGANAYKVVASMNFKPGSMLLYFLPSGGKQKTYTYYPYTFSTETGYIDPNRSRVPSIMMTKRHTMNAFMPAIAVIKIKNNDGKSYFNPRLKAAEDATGADWLE